VTAPYPRSPDATTSSPCCHSLALQLVFGSTKASPSDQEPGAESGPPLLTRSRQTACAGAQKATPKREAQVFGWLSELTRARAKPPHQPGHRQHPAGRTPRGDARAPQNLFLRPSRPRGRSAQAGAMSSLTRASQSTSSEQPAAEAAGSEQRRPTRQAAGVRVTPRATHAN